MPRMALDFVKRQAKNYLHSSHANEKMYKIVTIIDKYSLLSAENQNLIQKAKANIENLKLNYGRKTEGIKLIFKKQIQEKQLSIKNCIETARKNVNLDQLSILASEAHSHRCSMDMKLYSEKAKFKKMHLELGRLKKEIKSGANELRTFQSTLKELSTIQIIDSSYLEMKIQKKKDEISKLKIQLKARLDTDKSLVQDKEFLLKLQNDITAKFDEFNHQKFYEQTCSKFDRLSKELSNCAGEKQALESKIQRCRSNPLQTQGLYNALMNR